MDRLTAFGFFAVSAMLVTYALESRSHWFVLAFAGACALGSAYGFLQGAWPFGVVEAIWAVVAFVKWRRRGVSCVGVELFAVLRIMLEHRQQSTAAPRP